MEKQDYSRFSSLSISNDLPITFVNFDHNIDNYFQKLQISTLEELFNAYDNGVFNNQRIKFNRELKGQIEILMSYYIGTPLIFDDYLEAIINISSVNSINAWFTDSSHRQSMRRLGITEEEFYMLYYYCSKKNEQILSSHNGKVNVMDIIRGFANENEYKMMLPGTLNEQDLKVIQNIKFKADFLETYLANEKKVEAELKQVNDTEGGFVQMAGEEVKSNKQRPISKMMQRKIIRNLESQIKYLLKERENLDTQIELLQNQLENIKTTGGIKK